MDELIELERAGWASLCDGTGDDFYGTTMTDDGVMVLADGSVMGRADVVAALGQAPPWASFEMDDVRVVPIGEDSAALVYVGTGHRDGDAPPFVGVMTSVYVRRDGRWRLALYQQTPKPQAIACGELLAMSALANDEAAEVAHWSDVYEAALLRHDVDVLNELFWDDPAVLRFGIADQQSGYAELVAWRAGAPRISPAREVTRRHVVALAPGVVAVDLVFADDAVTIGRQSQTWIRTDDGWRIARAHVSVIPTP